MGGDEPHERAIGDVPIGSASGHLVLVVDDEPAGTTWIAGVLERAGIRAVAASGGKRALRLVAGGVVRPDVLLTAIEMPAMSGIELAARMLALRPGLRVVMMTADPARAAAARDRHPIVATVLMKPLDADELLSAVGPESTPVTS